VSKVKICGLSRTEDIHAVNLALPDFIGFVFAKSHRQVDENKARMLKKQLDSRIKVVGVFVNQEIDCIERLYTNGIIDLAQLHGDEDEQYIRRLKEHCSCPVIKAISIGSTLPKLLGNADYFLFDTLSHQRGGTGESFDWSVLKNYDGPPYFLAGGLNIDNVLSALHLLTPFCIDVSSGVETDGIKDAEKICRFVCLVRGE
jgi:phosphoribosylanthranilate isomerase